MGSMAALAVTACSLVNMAQIWGYGMAIANAGPGFAFSVQLLIVGFQVLDPFIVLDLLSEFRIKCGFDVDGGAAGVLGAVGRGVRADVL